MLVCLFLHYVLLFLSTRNICSGKNDDIGVLMLVLCFVLAFMLLDFFISLDGEMKVINAPLKAKLVHIKHTK